MVEQCLAEVSSDALVVLRVEVCECAWAHVGAAVGRLHRVAAHDPHRPEDDPPRRLLVALDVETAWEFLCVNDPFKMSTLETAYKVAFCLRSNVLYKHIYLIPD